jgi:hypothetical protein
VIAAAHERVRRDERIDVGRRVGRDERVVVARRVHARIRRDDGIARDVRIEQVAGLPERPACQRAARADARSHDEHGAAREHDRY